jgi:hypothetical protein
MGQILKKDAQFTEAVLFRCAQKLSQKVKGPWFQEKWLLGGFGEILKI